jgi:hypothetical protein
MRNSTLLAAIAALLSQKFATEQQTEVAKPQEKPRNTPTPRCMGMDCFCGGDCPDLKKEQSHG